jgi:hypothetical protein
MAYIKKSFTLSLILISILLFSACEENSLSNSDSHFDATYVVENDSRLKLLLPIELDSVFAVQHAGLKLPNTTNYPSGKSDSRFFNSAVFSDGDKAIQMENVTCENTPISVENDVLPLKYFDYWPLNTGPIAGDTINWTFNYNSTTINTNCPLPNDFGEISISSGENPMDKDLGGILNWGNTGDENVVITFTYFTFDSLSENVIDSKILATDTTVNSGSYAITPSLFAEWELPADATHLNVHFLKGNHRINTYDKGNRKVLTLSTIETNYMFDLKK